MTKPIGKAILTESGIKAYQDAAFNGKIVTPRYFKFSEEDIDLDNAFKLMDINGWIKQDINAYIPIDISAVEYLCQVEPDKAVKYCKICGIYLENGTLIALAKPPYPFPPSIAQRFKVQVKYGNLQNLTDFSYLPHDELEQDLARLDTQAAIGEQLLKTNASISNLQQKLNIVTDIVNKKGMGEPNFDSGWFPISSQAGTDSYKEISHDLGSIPKFWTAYAKADTSKSDNSGLTDTVFVVGVAHTGDDEVDHHGGLVAGATDKLFRIWVPDKSNNGANGRVISIYDGWGGEVNVTQIQHALVKILAWK